MAKKYDDENGVWRTIGGRRVFIKEGQSMSEAMKESGKFKKKALGKGLKDLEQKEPDGEGVKELFGEDDNKKQIDKETSEMNDKDLKETYDALERNDNSYEANKIREEYDKRYGKQQQDDYTPSDEKIGFNPREAVDYYLKKGDFEKADELINDYALEDERDEFIEGQRPLVRSDYYKHRKQAELTDKARDQIINGYDDYDETVRNFAEENNIRVIDAEDYFELAGKKLGIKQERVSGIDDKRLTQPPTSNEEDNKPNKALGKGLNDLGKEKLDGEGTKKLFDDNSSEAEKSTLINEYSKTGSRGSMSDDAFIEQARKAGMSDENIAKEVYKKHNGPESNNTSDDNIKRLLAKQGKEEALASGNTEKAEMFEKYENRFAERVKPESTNDIMNNAIREKANERRIPSTKMKTTDEKDARNTMYNTILRDANKRYDNKEISKDERNNIIDNAHDKLIKQKDDTKITISDALRRKAYQKYLKEHPASKMTFNEFKKEQE